MNVDAIRAYFDAHLGRQPGTEIQHGHPSPRFWAPVSLSLEELAAMRCPERKLVLCLHIPFCPEADAPARGFCLSALEDFKGYLAVEQYLGYLRRELTMVARVFGGEELASVHLGGGTPNVLRPADYGRVMGWIREMFRIAPAAEVTLEGVPQLFGEERLCAIAQAGITRISIGAQHLQQHLPRSGGRKRAVEQVLRCTARAHELGMCVNVDLICGWFDRTDEDLESDLRQLVPLSPESIVLHPLALAGPSRSSQERARLPSPPETCATYLRGRRYLEEHGYQGSSYTDFALRRPLRGPDEVQCSRYCRDLLRHDRLGVGHGASSLFAGPPGAPGMTFRNVDQTREYYDRIDARMLPTVEGFRFTDVDLRLLYVIKGIEGTPFLDAAAYARDLGGDLAADFAPHWQVLKERGWLEIRHGREYRLTGEGLFYTPMIQRCFSNDRYEELRAANGARRFALPPLPPV